MQEKKVRQIFKKSYIDKLASSSADQKFRTKKKIQDCPKELRYSQPLKLETPNLNKKDADQTVVLQKLVGYMHVATC